MEKVNTEAGPGFTVYSVLDGDKWTLTLNKDTEKSKMEGNRNKWVSLLETLIERVETSSAGGIHKRAHLSVLYAR